MITSECFIGISREVFDEVSKIRQLRCVPTEPWMHNTTSYGMFGKTYLFIEYNTPFHPITHGVPQHIRTKYTARYPQRSHAMPLLISLNASGP